MSNKFLVEMAEDCTDIEIFGTLNEHHYVSDVTEFKEKTCKWVKSQSSYHLESSCGKREGRQNFMEIFSRFKFCPFCGGKIEEVKQ